MPKTKKNPKEKPPFDSFTDKDWRDLKWNDPTLGLSTDEIRRRGNGDYDLGYRRLVAIVFDKPEPEE